MTTDTTLAVELLDAIKAATEAEKAFKADRGTVREYTSHCAMLDRKASLERLLRNDCNVEPELLLRVLL